jgi:hypothetical protein
MARGGKRKGAGRPKGALGKATLERQALRALFDAEAAKHFGPVVAEYFRLAAGQPLPKKTRRKPKGDPRLLIDFFNRTMGKPPESIEFGAGDGGPSTITVIHKQLKEK